MENLDAGRPVLCMGQIGPPEWGLLTGYAENGRTFFGRSYFDAQKTNPDSPFYSSDNIFHTQNRYRRAVDYPEPIPIVLSNFSISHAVKRHQWSCSHSLYRPAWSILRTVR